MALDDLENQGLMGTGTQFLYLGLEQNQHKSLKYSEFKTWIAQMKTFKGNHPSRERKETETRREDGAVAEAGYPHSSPDLGCPLDALVQGGHGSPAS